MADLDAPRHRLVLEVPGRAPRVARRADHAGAAEKWIGTRPKASGLPSVTWRRSSTRSCASAGSTGSASGWTAARRSGSPRGVSGSKLERAERGSCRGAARGRADAARGRGRVRQATRGPDGHLLLRGELGASMRSPRGAGCAPTRTGWGRTGRALPKGYRRIATQWVMSAKRPETRERRLAQARRGVRDEPPPAPAHRERPGPPPATDPGSQPRGDEALAVGAGAERPRARACRRRSDGRRSGSPAGPRRPTST